MSTNMYLDHLASIYSVISRPNLVLNYIGCHNSVLDTIPYHNAVLLNLNLLI